MAAPVRKVLFDNTVSPETGINTGNSSAYEAWISKSNHEDPVPVQIRASGTFSGATVKIEIALPVSPLVWTPATVVDSSDGTHSDLTISAAGTFVVDVHQGALIRGALTEGSPLGSVLVEAFGQINGPV